MQTRTLLVLARHGETAGNVHGVWQGSTDTPLSEHGRRQAECLAEFLGQRYDGAAALYSSHLERAHDTAAAVGSTLGLHVRIDRDLREYDLGSWEGVSYTDLSEKHQLWHHMRSDPDFAPHGGESPRQVTDRFTGALRRIAAAHPGERIVVVAHGGALCMAIADLVEGDYTKWRPVMDNCAVTELALDPHPELIHFNLNTHLEEL
jgi:broad specificity phosphatase PhoE